MHKLVDLYTGKTILFPDHLALARHWRRRFGMNFDQLNVTGNDMVSHLEADGYQYLPTGERVPTYIRCRALRRYQVLDDLDRPVDIRRWNYMDFMPLPVEPFSFISTGRKPHDHRSTGPSGRRASLRDADILDFDGAELSHYLLLNSIKRRPRTRMDYYSVELYYERPRKGHQSQCWKDQTKAYRQHGKHKRGSGRPVDKRQAPVSELDLEACRIA